MTTTQMPMSQCPACGYKMNAASGIDTNAAPRTNDFSVCIECGAALRFTHDGGLRECDAEDIAELSNNPEAAINMLILSIAVRSRK
jgi:hypothetical protein